MLTKLYHRDAHITVDYSTLCRDRFHCIAENWRLESSEDSKTSIIAYKILKKLLFGMKSDSICLDSMKKTAQISNFLNKSVKNLFNHDSACIPNECYGLKGSEKVRKATRVDRGTDKSESLSSGTEMFKALECSSSAFENISHRTNVSWLFRKQRFIKTLSLLNLLDIGSVMSQPRVRFEGFALLESHSKPILELSSCRVGEHVAKIKGFLGIKRRKIGSYATVSKAILNKSSKLSMNEART